MLCIDQQSAVGMFWGCLEIIKIMKFRSPFGVAILLNAMIFMKCMKHGNENPGGALGAQK